jgi:uncharacterized tellurite resistance protein B-like protein
MRRFRLAFDSCGEVEIRVRSGLAMIWLSNSTLARLRDQLLATGRRASIVADSIHGVDAVTMHAEYAPLCEAMYLMMSADGDVSSDEREVLRGALRNLSADALRGSDIDRLLDSAANRVTSEGRDARLKAVASELSEDQARAEVAFVLAAAIAFADNAIANGENETLDALADLLSIDETRAEALLDSVERDLASEAKGSA